MTARDPEPEVGLNDRMRGLLPAVENWMKEAVFPHDTDWVKREWAWLEPRLASLRGEVKARGWWCPQLPREAGGMGLHLTEFARLGELLGRSPLGHYLFNCQAPDAGNMEILLQHANAEQRHRFLDPLLRGDIRSCFAMTEPDLAGSNPTRLATVAKRAGDTFILNGRKWFTTGADGAAFAIVMALTDAAAESPYRRASMLLVPTDTEGCQLLRNIPVMGEVGSGYLSHGELLFSDCRVPAANLLGEEEGGFSIAQQRLGPGRIHHCMRWIGICERAFDLMCARAASRTLAEGVELARQQAIRHRIAECRAQINAARLLVLDTARRMDAQGGKAVRLDISLIKFFVAHVLQQVIDQAVQVHGALGITDHTLLSYWYRHERAARIYDGPDEVHKDRAARYILKAYGVDR